MEIAGGELLGGSAPAGADGDPEIAVVLLQEEAEADLPARQGHVAQSFGFPAPRAEARSPGEPISRYDPRSQGGLAYAALAAEVIRNNR